MSEYDDTNRGALFKNKRKDSDRHPDYTGTLNVGGAELWISAWLKVSQKGEKFMSISVKPKEERREDRAPEGKAQVRNDMDDEIPFAMEWR
jgi:uncharacterized protein (DUF736 family)